ncbi:hypothetical protein RBA41_27855 [Massilia sp. CCM 9210]|uniref:hypothetical protein n=1 Tax=Massilia scottii TaxID=3057166 RepID=UPI002796AC06|nr:hypothetical protein [Massilia sp. CCM 9210]MDQ1817127.1 hypothetical protein [Massilia sp. CCM 9210]
MYRTVIPHCTVAGPVDPVPYSHFISGAIPRKCDACKDMFEGGCVRAMDQVEGYLTLDHGPCPVKGPTHPVLVETEYYTSKVFVPAKCLRCLHLDLDRIRGFVCRRDSKTWGAFPRTLDWGAWRPDHPNLALQSGRSLTVEMLEAIVARDEVRWIKTFRASHADATIREARDAFAELVAKSADTAG